MRIRKSILSILIALITCFSSLSAIGANGTFDYGYSEITRGMGGSGVALPQDSVIAAINPAGMVFVGDRFDFGAAIYFPSIYYYANAGNPVGTNVLVSPGTHYSGISVFVLPDMGVNWQIDKEQSFGISIYSLAGFGSSYAATGIDARAATGARTPGVFGTGRLTSDLKQAIASLTYAHKITEHSSFGIALLLAGTRFISRGANALAPLTETFNRTGNLAAVTNLSNNGVDYAFGLGMRVGAMMHPFSILDVGASYQPRIHMGRLHRYSDAFPGHGEFDIPANGVIGIALHALKTLVFTADVQQIWYSGVSFYNNNGNALTNGGCSPATPQFCIGGEQGAGFGWRNSTSVKLGVQWQASEQWIWRAGWNYNKSTIRDSQILSSIIAPGAVIANVITGGATYIINKRNQLSGFLFWIPTQSVTGTNSLSGRSQTIRIRATAVGAGISWGWLFDA